MTGVQTWTVSERDMRGMAIRLCMLSTHYRKPKDFSRGELNAAAQNTTPKENK